MGAITQLYRWYTCAWRLLHLKCDFNSTELCENGYNYHQQVGLNSSSSKLHIKHDILFLLG